MQRLPIPEWLHREGVLNYGYHGISYEFIAGRLQEMDPSLAKGRMVVAHLGSGCSMCALVGGKSVEASWGFSALDGLPMGTRPGRLDPGVILYLLQIKRMSAGQIQDLLYSDCGLKGLSGISNDVRELLASEDPRARLALDLFSLRCARMVAELATVMGGIDGLIFTAGVGEHAAPVRSSIVSRLAWLGVALDAEANARHGPRISSSTSAVACYVIPTNEELMIARHASGAPSQGCASHTQRRPVTLAQLKEGLAVAATNHHRPAPDSNRSAGRPVGTNRQAGADCLERLRARLLAEVDPVPGHPAPARQPARRDDGARRRLGSDLRYRAGACAATRCPARSTTRCSGSFRRRASRSTTASGRSSSSIPVPARAQESGASSRPARSAKRSRPGIRCISPASRPLR